jgi:signal transduction histidine kinase
VQAQVEGVSGVWKGLTDNVNQLAGTLTTQLRAISEVSQAVTQGDLTRSIAVEAQGEVAELKDTINQMIANLGETTRTNQEQDWLNSNMARFTGMLQGERDLETVSRLIMSELTPLVGAQHGAFFMMESPDGEGDDFELRLISSYGYKQRKNVPTRFRIGEGPRRPVGARAEADPDHAGAGRLRAHHLRPRRGSARERDRPPRPVRGAGAAVVELGSFGLFTAIQQTFLEQLGESIGVVLNTIQANMRTEELLEQSQELTQELQSQSEELQAQQEELQQTNKELEEQAASLKASEELLQTQQEELQQTNEELEEKAELLEEQNRRIEIKNREIELARAALEEKAEQLALSSRYKSEFLANMSHELRTPLNSLLILAKLLAENSDENLSDKQIEFANTIYSAGSDLLGLINDILDLSKVEAGRMAVNVADVKLSDLRELRGAVVPAGCRGQGPRLRGRRARRERAADDRDGRAAPAAGAEESALERLQVHGAGRCEAQDRRRQGAAVRQRGPLPRGGRARVRGHRHRRRHRARQAAPDLRGVPAGRRDDEPPLRRHRARPLDQPRDRTPARRRDPRREQAGRGSTFTLFLPARYQHIEVKPARRRRRGEVVSPPDGRRQRRPARTVGRRGPGGSTPALLTPSEVRGRPRRDPAGRPRRADRRGRRRSGAHGAQRSRASAASKGIVALPRRLRARPRHTSSSPTRIILTCSCRVLDGWSGSNG